MPAAPTSPATAYIALGANLGDRAANLHEALAKLDATPGISVVRVSSFLENPAVGGPPDSPDFLNAAAELSTTLSSIELMRAMLAIEGDMGRRRRERWVPRPIDLDLLLYGNSVFCTPFLMLPHPFLHERQFVLEPLAEIAPDVVHPTLQKTIAKLASEV